MTYFETRMAELGFSPENYTLDLWTEVSDEQVVRSPRPIFTEDEGGNIAITLYDLQRNVITYPVDEKDIAKVNHHAANARHTADYKITRFNPEYLKQHPSMPKYLTPKGVPTYPFFPPELVKKYEQNARIDTLVITEGYFKAMKASICGVDCIGISGVQNVGSSDKSRKTGEINRMLYTDITRLINRCKPTNIIVLFDGDCTDISVKALEDMKCNRAAELSTRPQAFYDALRNLRELLRQFQATTYFAYVNSRELIHKPKGLDDLLVEDAYSEKIQEIVDDLNHPSVPGIYFRKFNLTYQKNLHSIFFIKSVEEFYEAHAEEIGTYSFLFRNQVYRYNTVEEKVEQGIEKTLANFLYVQGTYYLKDRIPNARDDDGSWGLVPYAKEAIRVLYGKDAPEKIIRNAFYKRFISRPSNTNYQQNINGYYNMYEELSYKPEEGEWEHIHELLNHIFGEDNSMHYQMALDYLQLLYLKPQQILPVICLVSKESGTGKTSFLNLLKYMFEGNCVIGGNDLITTNFNSAMAGKLVIGIDETTLGDNQTITEKIKMLATSEKVLIEAKGKDKIEMDNFAKFVLCSNSERRFIYTSKEEIRFWVMKVKPIPKEKLVPQISLYLEQEVPAFVAYLSSREMYVKEFESRMWFAPERLETEALSALKNAAMPMAERTLREYLHDIFMQTKKERLYFDLDYFRAEISDFDRKETGVLRNLIEINLEAPKEKEAKRWKMPFYSKVPETMGEIFWPTFGKMCRPYCFEAKLYIDADEYASILQHRGDNTEKTLETNSDKLTGVQEFAF